ncbi:MAG: guanylate kinase [Bacteroidales bacterium]|nr:guanylate kinase [Bacteroidales bacterium]
MSTGKLIIISAPSGCGKSTIINRIMAKGECKLAFSVSATNRSPRPGEKHGVNYYFLTDDEFRNHIENNDFVEYEEVYPGRYYGTLRSEIESKCNSGSNVILDIDVKGGVNVKKQFGEKALSLFIQPPSIEALRERLVNRGTDSPEVIDQRVGRAEFELSFAPSYDFVVVNDDLDTAVRETERIISEYINA